MIPSGADPAATDECPVYRKKISSLLTSYIININTYETLRYTFLLLQTGRCLQSNDLHIHLKTFTYHAF